MVTAHHLLIKYPDHGLSYDSLNSISMQWQALHLPTQYVIDGVLNQESVFVNRQYSGPQAAYFQAGYHNV